MGKTTLYIKGGISLMVLTFFLLLILPQSRAQSLHYIVFSSDRTGFEDIYVILSDGSNMMNITNSTARDYHPSWAPDGRRIVFASNRTGDTDIFIMDNNGENVINLTKTPEFEERAPEWSPDGQKVVFTSNRDGGWDLYTIEIDTGAVDRLTTDAREKSTPTWFPDSVQVAYWASEDGSTALFVVDTISKHRNQLTAANGDSWPTISSDGKWLAFESALPGTKQIFVKDLAGSAPPQQITTAAENVQPEWSPDDQSIAFVSTKGDVVDIYVINRDGSGLRQLTAGAGNDVAPAWQPVPAPITGNPIVLATATPEDGSSNGDGFSLSQSFERVYGEVDPDVIETLGNSEARLVPDPPYSMRPEDIIRLRVEVEVLPDGTVTINPTPDDPNNTARVSLEAFTYMSAEIVGVDKDRFDIYPPPQEPYMIRLREDQINFWEWEFRPKPDAVGQKNHLSVKFSLPQRDENGVIIRKEGENYLRFEINVDANGQPQLSLATTIPTLGLRMIPDGSNSLTVVGLNNASVEDVGIRSTRGEGWLDLDFAPIETLSENGCLSYVRAGTNAALPADCDASQTETLIIPYGDVFWYDYANDNVVDLLIILEGRYQVPCLASTQPICEF